MIGADEEAFSQAMLSSYAEQQNDEDILKVIALFSAIGVTGVQAGCAITVLLKTVNTSSPIALGLNTLGVRFVEDEKIRRINQILYEVIEGISQVVDESKRKNFLAKIFYNSFHWAEILETLFNLPLAEVQVLLGAHPGQMPELSLTKWRFI